MPRRADSADLDPPVGNGGSAEPRGTRSVSRPHEPDDAGGIGMLMRDVLACSTEHSIVALDDEGLIVLWNEGARRSYGYEPAEVLGTSWSQLYTQPDLAAALPARIMHDASAVGGRG